MPSFDRQCVLITAGASGIGHAIATSFAEAGAGVHVVDVDESGLEKLNADHPAILTSVADVVDESAVEGAFERHNERFGGLEVMVNCAGIAGPTALLEEIALADWRRCIGVNLDGTFLCCRKAIPLMRRAGKGCIINISSTAGWHGYPLRTPYSAAKWAIIGLTKSIAMELGPAGIRANVICPGSIDGERMDRVIEAEAVRKNLSAEQIREKYTAGVSLRTFIAAQDIADTALFLASPAASKITGQVINVDGHLENIGGLDQ